DHRLLRFVVREGARAAFVGQRQAQVVHGQRIVLHVLGADRPPRAGELELRRRAAGAEQDHQQAEPDDGHGAACYQVDEHGVGSHFEPSGSFLKCGLVTYGAFKYTGSSTTMLTRRSWPPWASGARSKCSVTVAFSLYGT